MGSDALPAPAVAELGGTEPRRGWQQGHGGGHEPCGPAQRGHAEHRPLHRRAAVLLLEPRVGSAGGVLKAPAPAAFSASAAANPRYSGESALGAMAAFLFSSPLFRQRNAPWHLIPCSRAGTPGNTSPSEQFIHFFSYRARLPRSPPPARDARAPPSPRRVPGAHPR